MVSSAARKAWATRRHGKSQTKFHRRSGKARSVKFSEVHVPFDSNRKLKLQQKGYVTWGVDGKGYILVKRDAAIKQLRKGKAHSKKLTRERRAFENVMSPEEYDKLIAKFRVESGK